MQEDLHTYKDYKICIKECGYNKYQLGIYKKSYQFNGMVLWLDKAIYTNLKIATSSGVQYACICIDKLLLSNK